MKGRTVLLAFSVFVVGLLAMPTTLSLLSGQHTFYGGNDYIGTDTVQCKNCHSNIWTELQGTDEFNPPPHNAGMFLECKGCHRSGNLTDFTFILNDVGISGNKEQNLNGAHAAITVDCTFCHDMVAANITDPDEAHKPLYDAAISESLLKGANEACTVCHTDAGAGSLAMNSSKLNITVTQDLAKNYIVSYSLQ